MVQAMGSGIFLLGYILILMKYFRLFNRFLSLILIILSLLIKVGAAPFHFWFPIVIKGLC
jgi:NADH-ubiquinone oxidoreductase chain 2